MLRTVPVHRVSLADGEALVATVFDLLRQLRYRTRAGGEHARKSYDENVPYTPAWQERITGDSARQGHHGGSRIR